MPDVRRPQPAVRAPALLSSPWTGVAAAALLIIPFLVPIPMALRRNPVISPLGDQMHVVLLAAVTLLMYWRGPLTGRLGRAAPAAAVFGGAIEFIQIPFGRQASLGDFGLDLVGIGLVVGFVLWRGHARRAGLWLAVVLLLVIPWRLRHVPFVAAAAYDARGTFPVLSDLEGPRDHWLWGGNWAEAAVAEVPDSPAGPGHVIRVRTIPDFAWPSAELRRFPHDWTAYDTLCVDIRLVAELGTVQRIGVRLDDFLGRREKTWLAEDFRIGPEWRTLRIPLRDRVVRDDAGPTGRVFDLGDVDRLLVFAARPDSAVVFEIDRVRLTRRSD